jgi:ubiquinone/menaquinone biosynthesis C-methylase UbiE
MDREQVAQYWESNAEAWTKYSRAGFDNYRDSLNTPAFLAMLPPVSGLRGLDIGCGDGSNTRQVARLGPRMSAIDVAPTFVRHAQAVDDALGIDFRVADAAELPFEDAAFDFATAFMCLMDMPDQASVLQEAARVLRPGGFLQFSILHPCFVPPHRRVLRNADGKKFAVELAGYFERIDGRVDTWWFETVPAAEREKVEPFRTPRFHRTLSEWVEMICSAGLIIEQFVEPSASDAVAAADPVVADTQIVPLTLLIRARKPD